MGGSGSVPSVDLVLEWPARNAAAAVVAADGTMLGSAGDTAHVFRLASVTKLLSAYAALIAISEGVAELDEPAGPEGSTVRHLLAHASGLFFDEYRVVMPPGRRRIYSNVGIEVLADLLADKSGIPFGEYVREGLLEPLGMGDTRFEGSPAAGTRSTVADLVCFAAELQRPTLLQPAVVERATTVEFPGLVGVLPGFGRQENNDWGLGFEIRDHKDPHWTGSRSSPRTFGHFGQAGTFMWVDPDAGAACVALTDRNFGPWAAEAWPAFTDAVLADLGRTP